MMADSSVSPEVVRDDGAEAQHPHPVSQVGVVPGMAAVITTLTLKRRSVQTFYSLMLGIFA